MAKARKAAQTPSLPELLLKTLGEVDRPGEVCTSGNRPMTMPGLEVVGLGAVGLPLGKTQAGKLIKLCSQAPYGKGTETVVDTDVRRVWELDPSKFKLKNRKWAGLVAGIVDDVREALGLGACKLTAQLYKLLVYEKGGFFLPHRDGEKLDRMVATLVVALPAEHEGGELIVSHDGRQYEIGFTGAASGHELSYAAFYADCEHEVQPVRSGFRLCLTYNLTLAESRGKKGLAAPSYGATTTRLSQLLQDWSSDADEQKLAVTLEHRYSQEGLAIDKLKGIDRARAEVLFEAAEQADCVAHLALVTLWQSGSAEGGYDEYSYGRGRRRWYDYDEDESGEETSNDYEMGEVYDQSLSANHWSNRQGGQARFGEIHFSESEIVAEKALSEQEPSNEDFEGFTGNAGMTLERWYHQAAVVIWPRAKHYSVLCDAGTDASIGGLEPMVKRLKRAPKAKREVQRGDCLFFARAIIDSWQVGGFHYSRQTHSDLDRNVFHSLLCQLDDVQLMRRFLSAVMPADPTIQLDNSFVKLCKQHGWVRFEKELTTIVGATAAATLTRNAELLRMLCVQRDKDAERIAVCQQLSEQFVDALKACDKSKERDWRLRDVDRRSLLVSLVTALLSIGAETQLKRLVDHAMACEMYDLSDAHLAALFALKSRLAKLPVANSAIVYWLAACRSQLDQRTANAPQKPTDFQRASKLPCNCKDCGVLSRFLADPDQRVGRFPLAKARRQHLHNIIDSNACDCTHVTMRSGRPYTLVCTKTTASYDAARETYERDLGHLAQITAMEQMWD